jgi:tetratricopeptide (TPR) repeat protein
MNNMASALIQLGAFQEAADYAARALALRKDYVPSLVNSGIACGQLGKFAEAEAYLERAYRLEPANRTVLLNLGLLEEGHQSDEKAAETYARLSALGDAQGCLGLARISERQGKTAAAIDHYRAAMARERRDSQIWNFANDRIAQLTR